MLPELDCLVCVAPSEGRRSLCKLNSPQSKWNPLSQKCCKSFVEESSMVVL